MASPEILFRGARVVDPRGGRDEVADVHVRDGLVVEVGHGLTGASAEIVDCDGLVLAPGLVDMHSHLREPGFEHKETIESGTRAAAAGGYTAVAPMANTDPVADDASVIAEVVPIYVSPRRHAQRRDREPTTAAISLPTAGASDDAPAVGAMYYGRFRNVPRNTRSCPVSTR